MMDKEHKSFDGRRVKIPNPRPGYINPFAGKTGTASWAGWADQYCVYVDGLYLVRCSAKELEPNLIPEDN
jgi:hypothetical protein